jgi:hypothetical protein
MGKPRGLFWWEYALSPAYLESELPDKWREHSKGGRAYCDTVWSTRCIHFRTGDKVTEWFDGPEFDAPPSHAAWTLSAKGPGRTQKAGGSILSLEAHTAMIKWIQEHDKLLCETEPFLVNPRKGVIRRQRRAVAKVMAKLKDIPIYRAVQP